MNTVRAGCYSCAPDLIHAEIGNIAWKKQRFQGMPTPAAQRIIADFGALTFTLTSSALLVDDALRLAITHGRSVYDSLYVALSVRESCRLVTADDKLANALAGSFPNIIRLALWP